MPKEFYTDRDIDDMIRDGKTSLVIGDDVVVTDLARERAFKNDFQFIKEHDLPDSAPIRPYIVEKPIKKVSIASEKKHELNIEQQVFEAVQARVGNSVDPALLKTIVKRVINNIGGS